MIRFLIYLLHTFKWPSLIISSNSRVSTSPVAYKTLAFLARALSDNTSALYHKPSSGQWSSIFASTKESKGASCFMITPGEGFFKPAASSLLIVLFCYLCESERENLVFSLKIFCFFSAPHKRKRPPNISFQKETRKARKAKDDESRQSP